jgi:thiol-disulfide isomerase/thioredoxin
MSAFRNAALVSFFAVSGALAACAPAATPPVAEAPAPAAAADLKATGFITANPPPPEGARIDERGIARDSYGRPFGYTLLGQPVPEFTAARPDGTAFTAADLRGKWTIVDFWGVWCGDCVRDGPYVAALATAVAQDPELNFIAIHTPPSAARVADAFGKYGSVEAYFAERGFSYPNVTDADASVRDAFRVAWTPTYLVVDPEGIVRGFRTDLSAADGEPVKDFLRDVAALKGAVGTAQPG